MKILYFNMKKSISRYCYSISKRKNFSSNGFVFVFWLILEGRECVYLF